MRILEIGCGTGSSTVALAEQGAHITAIDVDSPSLTVARERCRILNLDVDFQELNSADAASVMGKQQFDFVLFYASLEHMTHAERIIALRGIWNLLAEGGFLCVIETPNRLYYKDYHTSYLPFFFWLPDDLAFEYSQLSPREFFHNRYSKYDSQSLDFLRQGRGVSFHEFDLAMGPVEKLRVLSSMSEFHRRRKPLQWLWHRFSSDYRYESFLHSHCQHKPRAFFERRLDLMIEKTIAYRAG